MQNNNIIIFYSFFCCIFILITTNNFSDYELINIYGQKDIEQYYMLAKQAPYLPNNDEKILAHVSSRYLIPYIAGVISYITNFDLFLTFKILNIIFLFLFLFCINYLLRVYPYSLKEKLILLSIIFLNPYVIRSHIFQPVQSHDLLFFSLTTLFLIGLIKDNFKYILISSLIMIFIRQTSIAFFIGGLFYLISSKKRDYVKIILFSLSFMILFKLNSIIGNSISPDRFNSNYAFGIFFFDFSNLEKLIKFLLLPFISFFPLLIIILSSMKLKKNINISVCLSCLIIAVLMIGQPIMGGPDWTQRNVVRISSLSYVISSFFTIYTFKHQKLLENSYLFSVFIIGLFFWSFHPLYSKFDFFSFLRF